MKRVLTVVTLGVAVLAGMLAGPAHAGVREKQHKLDLKMSHKHTVWARKETRWKTNHPNPTWGQLRKHEKWEHKIAKVDERMNRKNVRLWNKIMRKKAQGKF